MRSLIGSHRLDPGLGGSRPDHPGAERVLTHLRMRRHEILDEFHGLRVGDDEGARFLSLFPETRGLTVLAEQPDESENGIQRDFRRSLRIDGNRDVFSLHHLCHDTPPS
jgi:hypothetical protein